MSNKILHALIASTALSPVAAVLANGNVDSAAESNATAATDTSSPAEGQLTEVIVTARRREESLQDVPVSEQVVTGSAIQDLAITNVQEISKLSAGLSINNATPDNPVIVQRGVRWADGSGTPAIPIYLNEVPFDPAQVVQSIFDMDGIEVLRGPQGTERGAPSISGAIVMTTRKPNLDEIGGYVEGLYGTGRHGDIQGAINVPIIKDMFAVRVAGNIENSEFNRVRSVHSAEDPHFQSNTLRITALFQPIESLTFEAMYQRRKQQTRSFDQVVGTGSPGFAALGIAPNFNGPALTLDDRKSVEDAPSVINNNLDLITAHAAWQVLGQELSYNYGRQLNRSPPFTNAEDVANVLPGYEDIQTISYPGNLFFQTNEVRLASTPAPGQLFDYAIGYFGKHSGGLLGDSTLIYLPGAFGAPFVSPPGAVTTPVGRYTLHANTGINIGQIYDSYYGNLKFHFAHDWELSAGGRYIKDKVPVTLYVSTSTANVAFPTFLPAAAGGCPAPGFLPASPVYGPAYCDAPVPATNSVQPLTNHYSRTIYDVSLSHKFTDTVLGYVTTGTSYRSGLPAIGDYGLPTNLVTPQPETATSYELGVKTSWRKRLRVNADIFQIDYKNQLTQFLGVPYFDSVSSAVTTTNLAFYRNLDSRIRGGELEIAVEPIDHLALNANLSYSKITSKGGTVPCNNPTGPALTLTNPINSCASPSGQTLNASAPFQASVNGSYTLPLGMLQAPLGQIDGYVRFNVTYQGNNPNFGTSVGSTPAYAVLDLYAGILGNEDGWDLGFYAKNVFDKLALLTSNPVVNSEYALYAAPTGYNEVTTTLPREVGVEVRYAFGSR